MDINQEKEYRIAKIQSSKWNDSMKILNSFNPTTDTKYFVNYKDNCKGKEKTDEIETVIFIDESNTFSFNDGELILKDIEINSVSIESKAEKEAYWATYLNAMK